MDLILWRHAEAEDPQPGQPDAKRRLTPRGQKQARKMARWLRDHLPHGGKGFRVLVSPADRTQLTAAILGLPFELEPRISIGAEVDDLILASNWPRADGKVILVGHQPALGRLAAFLLTGSEDDWLVRKGSIWWFQHKERHGLTRGELYATIAPQILR